MPNYRRGAHAIGLPRILAIGIATTVAIGPWRALAQSDLPIAVQADILSHKIVDELKDGQRQQVLASFDEYHELEKQGIKMPPALLFVEAKVAASTGDSLRAFDALDAYLKSADRSDKHYQAAVEWYLKLHSDPKVQARAAALKASAKEKEAKRKAAEIQQQQSQAEKSRSREIAERCRSYYVEMARAQREYDKARSAGLQCATIMDRKANYIEREFDPGERVNRNIKDMAHCESVTDKDQDSADQQLTVATRAATAAGCPLTVDPNPPQSNNPDDDGLGKYPVYMEVERYHE